MKSKRGDTVFDKDEHPKPETTAESLAKLPTAFKKVGVVRHITSKRRTIRCSIALFSSFPSAQSLTFACLATSH